MTIRMAYEMVMPYHLHMPSYFLETFTEYPDLFFFFGAIRFRYFTSIWAQCLSQYKGTIFYPILFVTYCFLEIILL